MDESKRLLIVHEGYVPYAYQDSLGFLTIGVGHLIDRRKGGRLPDSIIELLLDWDIHEKENQLYNGLPWASGLDPVRRAVLLDMTFNLGITGLLGFTNTLRAVREQRWEDAAKGMKASKWYLQVGRRADRLAEMMRTGGWPGVLLGPSDGPLRLTPRGT